MESANENSLQQKRTLQMNWLNAETPGQTIAFASLELWLNSIFTDN